MRCSERMRRRNRSVMHTHRVGLPFKRRQTLTEMCWSYCFIECIFMRQWFGWNHCLFLKKFVMGSDPLTKFLRPAPGGPGTVLRNGYCLPRILPGGSRGARAPVRRFYAVQRQRASKQPLRIADRHRCRPRVYRGRRLHHHR